MPLEALSIAAVVLILLVVVLQLILLRRRAEVDLSPLEQMFGLVEKAHERTERSVREEIGKNREESQRTARDNRDETSATLRLLGEALGKNLVQLTTSNDQRLDKMREVIEQRLAVLGSDSGRRLDEVRQETGAGVRKVREEVALALVTFRDEIVKLMDALSGTQRSQLGNVTEQLAKLTDANLKKLDEIRSESAAATRLMREEVNLALKTFSETLMVRVSQLSESSEKRMDLLRVTVEEKLKSLQEDNSRSLEQMRQTVDEKLQGTLEKRLGESFKLVSERLEQVYKGLGEMQTLATGVGDLKRVLTNVKSRGTWGEVQLGSLLEQVLSPEQYETNFAARNGGERVEFAIRLPNRGADENESLYLPIDAKFPIEDYQRLVEAQERADVEAAEYAAKQLENSIRKCAKEICEKYINPPLTTDFAILFLPTEGLFAEVLRRTGLPELIQRDCRVVIAGPTTLWSILSSLQMGFRTLAIQKRSSEVWKVLGAVKTEFGNFAEVMERVKKKLHEASDEIEKKVGVRTRAIERKLREVESLPTPESQTLLLLSGKDDSPLDGD